MKQTQHVLKGSFLAATLAVVMLASAANAAGVDTQPGTLLLFQACCNTYIRRGHRQSAFSEAQLPSGTHTSGLAELLS